ncbi:glycosyltransferase family 39 protein [Salidesulfovibrio onnuriiensis]|uniref:glycosyltransferase family 39 protein n=1 Tax=Salidesulfovibrio onnuriiensis TaxID=2583823 RepID=UPI0011C6FB7E|nr:glycosyltransferase family 39 protein [Salidesulfovibrio onnuriiensis]
MKFSRRWLLLAAVFAFSIVVRVVTAEYVENGGDCVGLWLDARLLTEGMGLPQWTHHNMRWATVMPVWGMMKLLGTHPALYYVIPILFASVSAVLICLVGERLHSLKAGLAAAVLFVLYPQMTQTGSQIWPSVFEMAYLLTCFLLLLMWIDSRSRSLLLLAAAAFFFGWGARVTAVYFLPGLLLLIWLPTRDFKALLLFCCSIGVLCLGELAWFWWDTGNPLGRIGLLTGSHVSKDELLISGKDYLFHFVRLTKLKGLLGSVVVNLVACFALLRMKDMRVRALAVLYIAHLVLEIWMVSSLSPLKIAQPIGSRYNCVVVPFGMLALSLWLCVAAKRRPVLAKGLFVVVLSAFVAFSVKKIPSRNSLLQTAEDYRVLQAAFAGGEPVFMHYQPWEPNWVETAVVELVGGKIRRKELSDFEARRVMLKNSNRITSLFMDDLERAQRVREAAPVAMSRYFTAYDNTDPEAANEPGQGVVIDFGRKEFKALKVAFPLEASHAG